MKITILLKSPPCSDEAGRALLMAEDMLSQGHSVNLYLLQEAVRLCWPANKCSHFEDLKKLTQKDLKVHVLTKDAQLRGLNLASIADGISEGSYDSLVDLMESCDRVIGIL
ncbi:MAG: hypothetical protein DRH15_07880 [Deltaproteobacteria bacterium]|nr:DsrE family protein [Deltaproteobacteria bacterium]MBW2083736.1 DsrE family protein [Deltaproteobacteria bacterium]RLB80171.1 MAG: hypothetical protein DRH15_07880 [Deltaproteobacteria bacterium]